jgi:hypothetical protein
MQIFGIYLYYSKNKYLYGLYLLLSLCDYTWAAIAFCLFAYDPNKTLDFLGNYFLSISILLFLAIAGTFNFFYLFAKYGSWLKHQKLGEKIIILAQFENYRKTRACESFREYIGLYPSIENDGMLFVIFKYFLLAFIYLIFEFFTLLIIFPLTNSTYTASPNIWYNITMITLVSVFFLGFFLSLNSGIINNVFELKE